MESNWRWNVAETGWSGNATPGIGFYTNTDLVAELITPFTVSGFLLKWIAKRSSVAGTTGTFGVPSLVDGRQIAVWLFTIPGVFPYGFAVHPDN